MLQETAVLLWVAVAWHGINVTLAIKLALQTAHIAATPGYPSLISMGQKGSGTFG